MAKDQDKGVPQEQKDIIQNTLVRDDMPQTDRDMKWNPDPRIVDKAIDTAIKDSGNTDPSGPGYVSDSDYIMP